jgi:hypothetical protein
MIPRAPPRANIGQGHRANALTPPPRSISSTQPLQNRRVRLYEVSEVSGNARVGALFAIVKLTKALYYRQFADQCEYSLPRGFDRCVIGEVVARYSSDHRQFVERHLASESALIDFRTLSISRPLTTRARVFSRPAASKSRSSRDPSRGRNLDGTARSSAPTQLRVHSSAPSHS